MQVDIFKIVSCRGGVAPSLLDTKSIYNRSSSPEDAAMDPGPRGLRDSYGEPMDFEEFKKGRPLKEVGFADNTAVHFL